MTTISLAHKSIHSKIKSVNWPQLNWKLVYMISILLCFSLLIFYVFSINQLTQGAYLVKNYNKEISALSKENKVIEADFAQNNLLDKIHSKVQELGFEKITNIKYVEMLGASLARAE